MQEISEGGWAVKNWLSQRTTWVGLLLVVVAVFQAYKSGGDMVTAFISAAALAGLALPDKKSKGE